MYCELLTHSAAVNKSIFLACGFLFDSSTNATLLFLMHFGVLAFKWVALSVVPVLLSYKASVYETAFTLPDCSS